MDTILPVLLVLVIIAAALWIYDLVVATPLRRELVLTREAHVRAERRLETWAGPKGIATQCFKHGRVLSKEIRYAQRALRYQKRLTRKAQQLLHAAMREANIEIHRIHRVPDERGVKVIDSVEFKRADAP
jgi:hypothetical protein